MAGRGPVLTGGLGREVEVEVDDVQGRYVGLGGHVQLARMRFLPHAGRALEGVRVGVGLEVMAVVKLVHRRRPVRDDGGVATAHVGTSARHGEVIRRRRTGSTRAVMGGVSGVERIVIGRGPSDEEKARVGVNEHGRR